MEPNNLQFGGGSADSVLSPLFAVALVCAFILILWLPRKHAITPLIFTIFTIPAGQVVVVAGVHFGVMRILILAGIVKWIISGRGRRGGMFSGGANALDRVFVLFAIAECVAFSLQWMNVSATAKSLGSLLDILGGYCVLRSLIQDKEDIRRVIKVFALTSIFVGACMLFERISHHNILTQIAGESGALVERDGKIRSSGPFEVCLTAGAFGAMVFPLMVWLVSDSRSRILGFLGGAGATAITMTTVSSTPIMAYVAGIAALCFWPFRTRLRALRWSLVLSIIGLHLVMKAPVWALISHIDLTGSSSGYHRFMLVDNFIRHFSDWWLVGFKDYGKWGWDMWDLSNQYVTYGLTGGLITFVLVIAIISMSFSGLGRARKLVEHRKDEAWLFWCLGAALFATLVAFFGVGYFDQVQFAWYLLLAVISVSVSSTIRQPTLKRTRVPEFTTGQPSADTFPELSLRAVRERR